MVVLLVGTALVALEIVLIGKIPDLIRYLTRTILVAVSPHRRQTGQWQPSGQWRATRGELFVPPGWSPAEYFSTPRSPHPTSLAAAFQRPGLTPSGAGMNDDTVRIVTGGANEETVPITTGRRRRPTIRIPVWRTPPVQPCEPELFVTLRAAWRPGLTTSLPRLPKNPVSQDMP